MKLATFSFFLLYIVFNSIAAKTYQLKIKVIGRDSKLPIENARIYTTINNTKKDAGITNKKGELIITDLTEKSFKIEILSQTENYRNNVVYYLNSKRKNDEVIVDLSPTYFEQKKLWKEIDNKYGEDNTERYEYEKDTTDFIMADFKGGFDAMIKYVQDNLVFPQESIEKNESGRVMIAFIVQADGQVTNVIIKKGISISIDEEAIRLVRMGPKWVPATYKGKPVKSHIQLPLNFSIN